MILSRPALELLSTPSFLNECRHRLYACAPLAPHSGCRFKTNNVPKQPYTSKQLVGPRHCHARLDLSLPHHTRTLNLPFSHHTP